MSFIIQAHFLEAQENVFFVKIGNLFTAKTCKMRALDVVGSMKEFHIYYSHKGGLCYVECSFL